MQSIEEATMTGLSLMFLLLGVVLIASIVMSTFNPYEQIAVANARKLAAIMNQACVSQGGSPIGFQFDLSQNVPVASNFLTVLPKWLMRNYGDPNYVLYYESFPPGEAIGWEVYHKFDNRLYVILDESFDGAGIQKVQDYIEGSQGKEGLKQKFSRENPAKQLEGVVVANLVLNDFYRGITVEKQDTSKQKTEELLGEKSKFGGGGGTGGGGASGSFESSKELFFGFGTWDSAQKSKDGKPTALDQEDYFRFKNYQALPTVQKTLIKYQSCGPYALCLKTRSGIYRFPLNACKNNNIKAVQLVYDARNRKAVYGVLGVFVLASFIPVGAAGAGGTTQLVLPGMGKIAGSSAGAVSLLSKVVGVIKPVIKQTGKFVWKHPLIGGSLASEGIFNVAESLLSAMLSMKSGNLVLASPCHITDAQVVVTSCKDAAIPNSWDYKPCSGYIKYPIFNVDKETEKLTAARNGERIIYHYECADKIATKPGEETIPNLAHIDNEQCIQLRVYEKPNNFCWTSDPSASSIAEWSNADTIGLAKALDFTPVRFGVEYIKSDGPVPTIVLTPTRTEELDAFLTAWGRRFSWGWPGFDFTGPSEFSYEFFGSQGQTGG